MRIACLHTIESNIEPFEAASRALGLPMLSLRHEVRDDLLAAVGKAGVFSPPIVAATVAALQRLGDDADGVLLTCSTLGPAAVLAQAQCRVPVSRVDQGLAQEAVRQGGTVAVLCTASTTLDSTRELFEAEAGATGASIEIRHIPGAWDEFKAGRLERYDALIAEAADEAFRQGIPTVALAQVSMAPAAALCREGRPLVSPSTGLRALIQAVGAMTPIRTGSPG